MQLIWREVFLQPFIIEVTSNLHLIAAAFLPSSLLPAQSAARFPVRLIKLLSPVVCNCLIRVLVIIVIKESSVHFRKKEGKKHVFPPLSCCGLLEQTGHRRQEENRGRIEPPNGDAIANVESSDDMDMICTNNHFLPNIYSKKDVLLLSKSFLSRF